MVSLVRLTLRSLSFSECWVPEDTNKCRMNVQISTMLQASNEFLSYGLSLQRLDFRAHFQMSRDTLVR
jgi:hypothetical protein